MNKSKATDDILKTYEDPSILKGVEIDHVVEQVQQKHNITISKSLVYKRMKRLMKQGVWKQLGEQMPTTPKEPVITIKEFLPEEKTPEAVEEEEEPEEAQLGYEEAPTEEIEEEIAIPTEEEIEAPEEAIPIELVEPKDIEELTDLAMGKLADFTDFDGWKFTPEEKQKWCPRCANILNKYVIPESELLIKWMPVVLFIFSTAIIFGGKGLAFKKWKDEQEEEKKKAEKPIPEPVKEAIEEKEEKLTEGEKEVVEKVKTAAETQAEIEEKKRSQRPNFMKKI